MERIAIDLTGPLPRTRAGNSSIMVVADYFTKWVEAFPLPDQTAGTVARTLVEQVVTRFGAPLEIHTDQGQEFEAALFRGVCQLLGIRKTSGRFHEALRCIATRVATHYPSQLTARSVNDITCDDS